MPKQAFGRTLLEQGYTLDRYARPILPGTIYDVTEAGPQPCSETVTGRRKEERAMTTKPKRKR